MQLASYLLARDETQASFALRVGVAKSTISRLCRGETTPEAALVAAIVRETSGEVLPNDLFPAAMAQVAPSVEQPSEAA